MRANTRPNILRYAFVLAPLFAGCPGPQIGDSFKLPGGGLTFPDCSDGQLVSADATGKLNCLSAPVAKVDIAACSDNQALTSDGTKLVCVDKAQGGSDNPRNTTIENVNTKVDRLSTTATNIKNTGGGTISTWAGNTTGTYSGNFVAAVAGSDHGFVGAAAACVAQFGGGAHLCTVNEIYHSAVRNVINSTKNIAKAWVYAPSWQNPISTSMDKLQGLGDTCGSMTYPTGDLGWTGIAVSTGVLRTTRWGVRFHGGTEAPCSTPLPIACCK